MPTHSMLPFVNSPEGIAQDIPTSNNANIPVPCSSITPHNTYTEKAVLQSGEGQPLSCMFCDQTFTHQDELGPHVLTQHPTTFFEPTVLRIEAEFKIPGERPQPKPGSLPAEGEEIHRCIVCSQEAQDASELEAHMRKHKDYFTYCCGVCGRRFRESWFLKNHMKMHVRPGPKSKALQDLESPFTINNVTQEPASEPVLTVYKMCMVCGFFFPDHDSLVEHSKVHNRETEQGKDEAVDGATVSFVNQESFLYSLNLQPASTGTSLKFFRSSKWIPQLDPFNTYQAWQLATKGKIAVGLNSTKDTGQEVSTDNEDCGSDKEEMSIIWSEGQGDKAVNEDLGRELRSQQQAVLESPNLPKRSLIQKHKDKERPTTCEECQRTFRTYHQLVLHSRVHKRERPGGESPTSSFDAKMPRMDSMDPTEEGHEETTEENLIAGEDDFDRSKARSKACNYCGKSFRSSYYLTVHMRTHTGEKPYKCAYCDYAAAQKTSLKYHLDRRHKDKPYMKVPIRPVPSLPSLDGRNRNDDDSPAPNGSKFWVPEDRLCTNEAPEDRFDSLGSRLGRPLVQVNTEYDDTLIKCPIAVNLKKEKEDLHDGNSEVPLNLSLKVSLSIPAREETKYVLSPISCSRCAYKTMYPEVLMMHKKLIHKDKSDSTKKYRLGGSIKQNRYTGCPPALNGKDVTPLPMTDRSYPRRTKSPSLQPAKPQVSTPVNSTHAPKSSPSRAPQQESVQETQRYRQNADLHPSQGPHRYTELMRKTSAGNRFIMDRTCPLDRVRLGETSYPAQSGAFWHSDAARLCLSNRFGSLPQVDFGEPSGKRPKFSVPTSREAETGVKPGPGGPTGDGPTRLQITGRSVKPTSLGPGPSTASNALCPIQNITTPLDRGLDSDWSMINLLRSCTPSDLASLYHSTPTNPAHGGLPNPRAGSRTRLYQQLPGLPTLQRRDPSGVFSNHRYGTTDKNSLS